MYRLAHVFHAYYLWNLIFAVLVFLLCLAGLNNSDWKNYRPISNFSVISKLLQTRHLVAASRASQGAI